ncbi:hypothetical protein J1N35_010863 [Gossypium stocksii]|uniref:DUF4283 domain-containing protein n=1 Tax=Gossypium stocksii TaxID=47602 RepID=A0A9D3W3E2_9ROSI|nr:hypothetical protein J1N35_010863 [Gossypium stocksii]
MVGKVVKLDFNTDIGTRGHFARMVIFLNRINRWYPRSGSMEYSNGWKPCPRANRRWPLDGGETLGANMVMVDDDRVEGVGVYGPWLLVERKQRHNSKDSQRNVTTNLKVKFGESRFNVLAFITGNEEEKGSGIEDLQEVNIKGKGVSDKASVGAIIGSLISFGGDLGRSFY